MTWIVMGSVSTRSMEDQLSLIPGGLSAVGPTLMRCIRGASTAAASVTTRTANARWAPAFRMPARAATGARGAFGASRAPRQSLRWQIPALRPIARLGVRRDGKASGPRSGVSRCGARKTRGGRGSGAAMSWWTQTRVRRECVPCATCRSRAGREITREAARSSASAPHRWPGRAQGDTPHRSILGAERRLTTQARSMAARSGRSRSPILTWSALARRLLQLRPSTTSR
mmetsp:Transcript_21518/g.69458  ORF Transcript_21518/g.69458 Transcript_21518/m.69458 type:complete len:229 (+) Transcript_21518:12-698(+)